MVIKNNSPQSGAINSLIFFSLIVFIVLSVTIYLNQENSGKSYSSSVTEALSENNQQQNFARADKVRKFIFPADSGPHPEFQTEWWYYTGNLEDEQNNHYGFQLTFFRRALTAKANPGKSKWRSNQIYFAHFTVSDIKNKKFYSDEKYSRGGAELSGAIASPYKVWIENWSAGQKNKTVLLKAENENFSINLNINSLKAKVFHGNKGLSQKSSEPGNASYYYSETRLNTEGTIRINNKNYRVKGLSWLDREWSTSVLSKKQSGWDWFSIQLEDQREIMLYQLRLKNGGVEPNSSGTLIEKDGKAVHLTKEQYEISVLDKWQSPETKIKYPAIWQLKIPAYNLNLKIIPYQPNQELNHSLIYWEGAVKIQGNINGNGYVELTGYE